MKKSKFVLLSLVLIVLAGFGFIFHPAKVHGASEGELDIDIEELWVANGWPLSAMNYYDYDYAMDGKGIRFYVELVAEIEFEGTIYPFMTMTPVYDYNFDDGTIDTYNLYPIFYQFCSNALVSMHSYYRDTYGLSVEIPEYDRILVIWDVEQQMFVSTDYLLYYIDTSFDKGYQKGIIENHESAYYAGYDTGYGAGYEVGLAAARPEMDILLITLIMFILSVFVYFKFRLKWVLIATVLLWFVPIFLVENLFIKIFSVIMIIVTITLTFFGEREEEF